MAHVSNELMLDVVDLTTAWQVIKAPTACNFVEFIGTVEWEWATDETVATRSVQALTKEVVVPGAASDKQIRFAPYAPICKVRGKETGKLYRRFIR